MTNEVVRLPFLETRAYVHGTTLFEALAGQSHHAGECHFRVKRVSRENLVEIERAPLIDPVWTSWLKVQSQTSFEFVGCRPIACDSTLRSAYDEDLIIKRAEQVGGTLIVATNGVSTLAAAVPLMKQLLRNLSPQDSPTPGQWMLTDYFAQVPSVDAAEVRVTILQTQIGRMSRALVDADGRQSFLHFAWVRQSGA